MNLRETGWDGVDWMDTAQDRDQWRALVNKAMNKQQLYCNRGTVFSTRSAPRYYKAVSEDQIMAPSVEKGSNTSTVTLRIVGGDGRENLESETVKYGHQSHETLTRELLPVDSRYTDYGIQAPIRAYGVDI
jgi:hypothetical protein